MKEAAVTRCMEGGEDGGGTVEVGKVGEEGRGAWFEEHCKTGLKPKANRRRQDWRSHGLVDGLGEHWRMTRRLMTWIERYLNECYSRKCHRKTRTYSVVVEKR
jgi:hypothetical protein